MITILLKRQGNMDLSCFDGIKTILWIEENEENEEKAAISKLMIGL